MTTDEQKIITILEKLSKSSFRARFRLKNKEIKVLFRLDHETLRNHARDIIVNRLGPAYPPNDGRQTPMRNHPVFVAQHATASCCRKCLKKWHNIPTGKELEWNQIEYIIELILTWIDRQPNTGKPHDDTELLF